MAESKIYLDQLTPAELFRLLNKAASTYQGQFLDQIKILLPDSVPFQLVALELPDPHASISKETFSQEYKEIFDILTATFKEITGRGERVHPPGGQSKALLEGIAWILINSLPPTGEEAIETDSHQFLVVSKPTDLQEGQQLFKQLSFHATYTRVSSVTVQNGTGSPADRFLFHIKDDPKRKSSFQSASASGILDQCTVLKGFPVEGVTAFLPPEAQPDKEMLRAFNLLLDTAPRLFSEKNKNRSQEHETPELSVAVIPGKDVLECLYLDDLKFYGEERFTVRKARQVSFQYMDLDTSKESLDRLAETLHNAKPFVGYRLELKPTQHIDKNRIQRLTEQKARIDYQLAYLKSISRPRPLLMRFSQAQLPALAAEIRSFPIQVILEGSIKYGFQATKEQPGGFHYLFIDPSETARLEIDPYPLWCDLGASHMRFRLDPFWASHYFDTWGNGEAMVFVPEGSTIYPPFHAWEPRSMDKYLKDTLHSWFETQENDFSVTIPDQPVYIFDGEPVPDHPVSISILDRERLQPLHTRLGWLNDNLVIHQAIEKEEIMTNMAADLTWQHTAQHIKTHLNENMEEFRDAAFSAVKNMADATSEMTGVLNSEVNRVDER